MNGDADTYTPETGCHETTQSDTDVVRAILEAALGGHSSSPGEGISESLVIQSSDGHVYIGHDGYRQWLARARPVYRESRFEETELRELGEGFVLLVGTTYGRDYHGDLEAQPGAWLMHVSDRRLNSIVFFRTVDQALAAASSDTPQIRRRVVEQLIDAFNRSDYATVLASVSSDYRFTTPLFEGVPFHGHFDAGDVLESLRERYPVYRIDSWRITELGHNQLVLEAVNRAVRDDGLERVTQTAWLMRIERGLLRETSHHRDLAAAIAAFRAHRGEDARSVGVGTGPASGGG